MAEDRRLGPRFFEALADRAYDSDALRQTLADRGAWANVKPMPGRVNVPVFSPYLYRLRNLVGASSTSSNISGRSPRASKNNDANLSCTRQTRRRENLDALYESVT